MSEEDSRANVSEAIKTSLTSFCRIELPDSVCIDWAIGSVGIEY